MDHLVHYYINNNSHCTFLEGKMPAVAKVRRRWGNHFAPYRPLRQPRYRRYYLRYLDLLTEPLHLGNPTPPATPNLGLLTAGSSSQADETHNRDYEYVRCHMFMPTHRPRLMYWKPGEGSIAIGPAISVIPHAVELRNDYGIILPAGMAVVVYNVHFRMIYYEDNDDVDDISGNIGLSGNIDVEPTPSIFARPAGGSIFAVPAQQSIFAPPARVSIFAAPAPAAEQVETDVTDESEAVLTEPAKDSGDNITNNTSEEDKME
ncbi:hypothetical protein VHEMI07117 [[Torrubiella] hemipterigena]|uniref:Uncharacterized protein n=1 Tax=[Torrubiella] hemipterigena TaxID=1531966 RepID=A0A0A1T2J0_9HYPO|nr:hypothetical protein VHEMI07117 [[Torrubiella] hemipterigena]